MQWLLPEVMPEVSYESLASRGFKLRFMPCCWGNCHGVWLDSDCILVAWSRLAQDASCLHPLVHRAVTSSSEFLLAWRCSAGTAGSHAAEGPGSGAGGGRHAGLAGGSGAAAATTTNATEAVSGTLLKLIRTHVTSLNGNDTGSILLFVYHSYW